MANLPETETYDEGVYQIELTDPVVGGSSGISNAPLKNLANRTAYLKAAVNSASTGLSSHLASATPHAAASVTVSGIVELATSAETQTGTDSARAVTPAGLASKVASDTAVGLVELATSAEVQTGTDTTRVVTPAGLAARTATESRAGIIELATAAEVQTGTDAVRAVTPAGILSQFAGSNQDLDASSGFQRLPGGLILQWGAASTSAGSLSVMYPLAFPSAVCSVLLTITGAAGNGVWGVIELGASTLSGFAAYTASFGTASNGASNGSFAFNWMAIGY